MGSAVRRRINAFFCCCVALWSAHVGAALPFPYVMPLEPAKLPSDQVYRNASLWSWGGSVITHGGKFHLFAAAFVEGCGLSAWETNSQTIHAVADNPLGPFVYADVAVHVWSHNPQAVVHPDGTILLYTIGMDPEGKVANCTRGGTPPAAGGHGAELVELHYATDPAGPWTQLIIPGASYGGRNIFNGTNPSPWVMPNGTVVVASHGSSVVVSTTGANDWRGPYEAPRTIFTPPGSTKFEGETCQVHHYARVMRSWSDIALRAKYRTQQLRDTVGAEALINLSHALAASGHRATPPHSAACPHRRSVPLVRRRC